MIRFRSVLFVAAAVLCAILAAQLNANVRGLDAQVHRAQPAAKRHLQSVAKRQNVQQMLAILASVASFAAFLISLQRKPQGRPAHPVESFESGEDRAQAAKRWSQQLGDGDDSAEIQRTFQRTFSSLAGEGWEITAGVSIVRANSTKKGSLDYFLRSPGGGGFSIDASSWDRRAVYSEKHAKSVLAEAVGSAQWASRMFNCPQVFPVVCLTSRNEKLATANNLLVHVVPIDGLLAFLRARGGATLPQAR